MIFRRSNGQAHDAPEGRALLESWEAGRKRAASGDGPRLRGRRAPWPRADLGDDDGRTAEGEPESRRDCDRGLYKLRNEVERLFRRLKGCRRICTRFDKLDAMFLNFALVIEMICDLA